MVTRTIIALLLATAVLGCRDEGRQIVVVHLHQVGADPQDWGAPASDAHRAQPEAFERAVIREVAGNPDCGSILIAREVQAGDRDPLHDLARRPHWDLSIAFVVDDDRHSWMLAGDDYRVLREGIGTARDIAQAVCLQGGEALAGASRVSELR
jgi:hypothetical protein